MKEFKNGVWTPSEPEIGERVRVYDIHGGSVEKTYAGDNRLNKIVITSHAKRALVEVGNSLTVTVEIRDADDNLLPVTDSFAMPVGRVGGANYRTLMMNFVDGVCSKTTTWNDAGEFEVTESMINVHLDENSKLEFSGFNISVAE